MIDVHCHLSSSAFDKDRKHVVERAHCTIIDSAIEPQLWGKSLDISEKRGNVHSSVGLDPCRAEEAGFERDAESCIGFIRANRKKIVAVGEVGLDFMKVKSRREVQKSVFRRFIRLADELELPVVVHSRWAHKQAIEVLIDEGVEKVVLHAFPGEVKYANQAAEAGFFISIPTSVLYSEQKQEVVQALEVEHLLTETDSPVMAPERGERNEPANVRLVVEKIAELKAMEPGEVEAAVSENARRVFGLKE